METVLLHKSAFLYVTSIFRLSSFVFANALLTGITKTFVPFYSSFPEILYKFVSMSGENCIMEEVFAKIKNGDQGAFEQVFRMFYMPLCDYAVMILGDQAEAEDVVQDLFTYLWRSRQEVRVQESVKSYLFTSVRFRALNVLKHKMIERKHGASLMAFIEDLQNSDYSEEEMQRVEQIKEVLQTLPAQCRTVFTMSCLDGKKYKEIADELGISVNTVKSHVMKAYRDIRARVGGEHTSVLLFIALQR